MNDNKLIAWGQTNKVPEPMVKAILDVISSHPKADAIIDQIVSENPTPGGLMSILAKAGINPAPVMLAMKSGSAPQPAIPTQSVAAMPQSAVPASQNTSKLLEQLRAQAASASAPAPKKKGLGGLFSRKPKAPSGPVGIMGAMGPKPKKSNSASLIIMLVILAIIVVLAVVAIPKLTGHQSGGDGYTSPSPTESINPNLTHESAKNKSDWASTVIGGSVEDPFLAKPSSVADFFQHIPGSWLIYFLSIIWLVSLVIMERQSAREFMDVVLLVGGIALMFLVVILAPIIAHAAASSGWPEEGLTNLILGIGFGINVLMQVIAGRTGYKDYSCVSVGIFASGMLLRWWYPDSSLYMNIGMFLLLLGIAVELMEIRRSRSALRSLLGSALMSVAFVIVFLLMFVLIQNTLANMGVPTDPTAQVKAALWLVILAKGQIAISTLIAMGAAAMAGMAYGAMFLRPKMVGKSGNLVEGSISTTNFNFLLFDSVGLFFMILIFCLPWIGLLPQLAVIFFP